MLTRRELLRLGLLLLVTPGEIQEARAEAPSASVPNYGQKAMAVYQAARKTIQTNKDYIRPEVVGVDGQEYLVSVRHVFSTPKSRYTVTTSAFFKDKTKREELRGRGGMDICTRTYGEQYNRSGICVMDNNLDGIVESGMTRKLGRVITPADKEWNQVCEEELFCAERRPYQQLFQQVYERCLDDLVGHLRLSLTIQ